MNQSKETHSQMLICELEQPIRELRACAMLASSLIETITANGTPADTGILEDASMFLLETFERNINLIENCLYEQ